MVLRHLLLTPFLLPLASLEAGADPRAHPARGRIAPGKNCPISAFCSGHNSPASFITVISSADDWIGRPWPFRASLPSKGMKTERGASKSQLWRYKCFGVKLTCDSLLAAARPVSAALSSVMWRCHRFNGGCSWPMTFNQFPLLEPFKSLIYLSAFFSPTSPIPPAADRKRWISPRRCQVL